MTSVSITISPLGASALRRDPGSPGSSLALVPTWGPHPPCPVSRPPSSPSNRHCSVGRSEFTTNYFVLREGQKEKRSWEGWGVAGGGDCLSRLCVYFNPWTAGHWLGGRARARARLVPHLLPHQLLEALSPPRLAVTLPTLSRLPVCLSSAASPTSLSPPHHLFSLSLCIPLFLHSLMAWPGGGSSVVACDLSEGASLGNRPPGVIWTDSGRGVRCTHSCMYTHSRPWPGTKRPTEFASVTHVEALGFI